MTKSEKYEILIAFLGREIPDIKDIKYIFDQAIKEEYQKSLIYVNVTIEERVLSCVDCSETERGYVITAVRNPLQSPDQELYYQSLGNVVFKVRKILDSPYTLVIIDDADVSFFPYEPTVPEAGR